MSVTTFDAKDVAALAAILTHVLDESNRGELNAGGNTIADVLAEDPESAAVLARTLLQLSTAATFAAGELLEASAKAGAA